MKIYKIAQVNKSQPYSIIVICGGNEKDLNITVWAFSEKQAKFKAINSHSVLKDYLGIGCRLVARLNKKEIEDLDRRKKMMEEREKNKLEQSKWWDKD